MSPSSVSNDSGVPAGDHGVALIEDVPDDVSGDRGGYRARHAQPNGDVVDANEPDANEPEANEPDANEPDEATEIADGTAEPPVDRAETVVVDVPTEVDVSTEWDVPTEWEEPEDFRFIVRPYTWTQGRTRPVQDLAVETLVSTSDVGRDISTAHSAEHSAIAGLCADVRSVAEVAALLALPLGVARVLLADMIDTGLVHVHHNPTELGSPPGLSLMERVLAGLQEL